jgi:hypothetical protein
MMMAMLMMIWMRVISFDTGEEEVLLLLGKFHSDIKCKDVMLTFVRCSRVDTGQ